MIKKIFCLMLALICVASMAVVGVSAADDTKIYFEVPEAAGEYGAVYCHIWAYGGDSFAAWQSKKEKCAQVEGNLYSYDISKVGALEDGAYYGVIFSTDGGFQTYDTLMGAACYGDTLVCDGTVYENPADSSKTALAAFWKGQDAAAFGPVKQLTSIGNLVGTCCPPGVTDETLFTSFLTGNLENARTYSGKDDQAIIDDMAAALNLDNATVAALIAETGVEVAWVAGEEEPTTPAVTEPTPVAGGVTVGGKTYDVAVGDEITYTVVLTTPANIENIQGFTSFDATVLELVEASNADRVPNIAGVVANVKDGVFYFNASEINAGYDFVGGKTLVTLKFKVLADAETTIATVIEEMCEIETGKDYITGSEIVADGVVVTETLDVPVAPIVTEPADKPTEPATSEKTDATSGTDAPNNDPTDVPETGATIAIAATVAVVAMAMAAVVVLRKKANA